MENSSEELLQTSKVAKLNTSLNVFQIPCKYFVSSSLANIHKTTLMLNSKMIYWLFCMVVSWI